MRGEAGVAVRKRAIRIAPNRTRIAAGILILVVSTIAGALLLGNQQGQTQIYVVSRSLLAGEVIEVDDLVPILVDGSPRFPVVIDPAEVAGQTLLQDLPKGTVLNLGHVVEQVEAAGSGNTVGLRLSPGSYPNGIRRGDSVLVVIASDTEDILLPLTATVTHISEELNSGGDIVVTLLLSSEDALAVASGPRGEMTLVGLGL